ncbi:MAG: hypothetical protein H7Z21_06805 [Hymenobacter sp.]|nr:hypothetical protein [Hymenobacter sp.]
MAKLWLGRAAWCLRVLLLPLVGCGDDGQPAAGPAPAPHGQPAPGPLTITNRYGRPLIFYAEVDKQGDYFRRMFTDPASAEAVRRTGELPDNALLVLETWFGPDQSTAFVRQKRGNEFESGSFGPGNPDFSVGLTVSCNNCHARAAVTDRTFTLPLLRRALQRNEVQTIVCNQPSFTPCDLAVYQGQ